MKLYILLLLIISVYSLEVYPDPCELTWNPKGWEECRGKETDLEKEVCCYLEGTRKDIVNKTYCADIIAEDVSTPEKRQETIDRIKNGTYWNDTPVSLELTKMICYDKDLKGGYLLVPSLLVIILLFLF